MLMQFVEAVDDSLWANVLMLIQATDVCTQLGHIVGIILIVVLILVEPIELRIPTTLEFMTEDVIFTLFRHATNGHLFLSLMGTIGNGCTLVVVLDARNGPILVDFVHFIVFLFVNSENCLTFAAEIRWITIYGH